MQRSKNPGPSLYNALCASRHGADLLIYLNNALLHGASRGGRLDTRSYGNRAMALAPGRAFFTFQCSFSGFRRPFSRFQSRFFGFQSQSLKSLAPRCPPGSTLKHFGHQFGNSFRWVWASFSLQFLINLVMSIFNQLESNLGNTRIYKGLQRTLYCVLSSIFGCSNYGMLILRPLAAVVNRSPVARVVL